MSISSIINNHVFLWKHAFSIQQTNLKAPNEFEQTALSLLIILVFIGFTLFYTNVNLYRAYVSEDGVIEWLTVIVLFCSADISFKRIIRLRSQRNIRFLLFLFLTALLFCFGAGEEISWGQRIFGIESSDFFVNYNLQKETNIHNLFLYNIRINKVVFSLFLGIVIGSYLLILPVIYKKNANIKSFVDLIAVPVPRNYHIVSYVVLALVIEVMHAPDKWELLEMVGSFMFFLIILNPLNREIFTPGKEVRIINE